MTLRIGGQESGGPVPIDWSLDRDESGYRTYSVTFRVSTDDSNDGPFNILNCPGLPLPGSMWDFLADFDPWVWCLWTASVERAPEVNKYGRGLHWHMTQAFTNNPTKKWCHENAIEDPLLEPMKISGDFSNTTEENSIDKDGNQILNSAFELIRGPQVEWDKSRSTVKFEQNVAILGLADMAQLADCLNDDVLWGLPARCWKFKPGPWDGKFYGQCSVYYSRSLTFESNVIMETTDFDESGAPIQDPVSGWDRRITDEGTKALNGQNVGGKWIIQPVLVNGGPGTEAADYTNPQHFVRFKDKNGENARVILNGHGLPYDPTDTGTTGDHEPGVILAQKYPEANLLLLGIPTTL